MTLDTLLGPIKLFGMKLLVFVWTVLSVYCVVSIAAERPNVVLIMTDDQGWADLGCHGNPLIETPVLDAFAGESIEFTRFYASPVCTAKRASLMAGRHYQRTGAFDTFMGRDTLAASEITLGKIFQKVGYRTGLFGKWHLGRYMKYHPTRRGFDEFFGFWQYGFINRYDDSDELFHNRERVVTTGYITDVITDAAISFVKAGRDKPFFLYVPYNAPHSPYLVPDAYIEKYLAKGLPLQEARNIPSPGVSVLVESKSRIKIRSYGKWVHPKFGGTHTQYNDAAFL